MPSYLNKTLTLFLYLFPILLSAQPGLKVEKITPKDGLSYRWVLSLQQDSKGFMWIGTFDGLNRYDGSQFTVYRKQENDSTSLVNNIILGIEEDQEGQLWLATEEGLSIFDPLTNQFRLHQPGNDTLKLASRPNRTIQRHFFPVLPEMIHWFQPQYSKLDTDEKQLENTLVERLKNDSGYRDLRAVTKNGTEAYWFWMRDHTYIQYNIKQSKWNLYDLNQNRNLKIVHKHLPIDAQGRFWFPSTQHNEDQPFDFFQLPDGVSISSWTDFLVDNLQNIWLKSIDGRFFHYDVSFKKLKYLGIFGGDSAFEDREGTKWLGYDQGITKITKSKRLFENYLAKPFALGETPPVGVSCRQMVELESGLVLMMHQTSMDDLYQLDPFTQSGSRFMLASKSSYSQDLFKDENENLWLTRNPLGLYRQSLRDGSYESFPMISVSVGGLILEEDELGRFWLVNHFPSKKQSVFSIFDRERQQFKFLKEYPGRISIAFFQKETEILWVAYQKGLIKVDTRTETFEYIELNVFQGSDLFGEGSVFCIWPWQDQLWLGSAEGLLQFDPQTKQVIKQFTIKDGLPDNRIYTVLSSEENLWLGTHNGLCRFNPKTLSVENFYVEDGLSHNEFNRRSALKTKDGKLWFGGLNGVNAFYPKDLENLENQSAELVWTKYSKYNVKEDTLIEHLPNHLKDSFSFRLGPNEQEFTFHFALLRFIEPSKNQYNWYLEGYEKEWSRVGNKPIVEYRNIKPGTYIFRVKAADHTGTIAQNELSATITILEVWYKRWWAWCLYILTFLLGSYAFYRFRLNRQLEQQESLRLRELDEVKNRLYTNITHEFRTPLTVMLGMAEQIKLILKEEVEKTKIEKASDLILRNGQNLLNLINRMLDLAKLESGTMSLNLVQGNIIQYLNYLVESFHSFAATKKIQLHFLPNLSELQMDYDPEKLQHIISNLLSNAIKFTPEGGDVYIFISNSASTTLEGFQNLQGLEALEIKIKDTGIGIAEEKLPHIFDRFYQADDSTTRKGEGTGIGLALVKELVKLMEGEIEVESELGKGTVFRLLLPIRVEKREKGKERRSTVDGGLWTEIVQPASDDQHLVSSDQSTQPPTPEGEFNPQDQQPVSNVQITNNEQQTTNNDQRITNNESTNQPVNQSTLLIIEDNPDVAHYIQTCLDNQYQITNAHNGQEGIDKALELIPDSIISDVMMPVKDGFEVVRTLKNDERTSHIPVILLTAKADAASKIEGLKKGADAYLAKPFNKEELQVRLQQLIELRRRLQERYAGSLFANPSGLNNTPDGALQKEDEFLLKFRKLIEKHLSDVDFDMLRLSRALGMSRIQIYRKVKALTNHSPSVFIRSFRLQKGKELLATTDLTVSEIAYEVGFSSLQYFSDAFFEEFGTRPSVTRK